MSKHPLPVLPTCQDADETGADFCFSPEAWPAFWCPRKFLLSFGKSSPFQASRKPRDRLGLGVKSHSVFCALLRSCDFFLLEFRAWLSIISRLFLVKSIVVTRVGCLDAGTSTCCQLCYSKVSWVSSGCCVLPAQGAGYKMGCKADSV